jgi:hypothetical protein
MCCRNTNDGLALAFFDSALDVLQESSEDIADRLFSHCSELKVLLSGQAEKGVKQRPVNGNILGAIVRTDADRQFTQILKRVYEELMEYFGYACTSVWSRQSYS